MIAFGPIPSRRLGQSLGINHIPPKSCTYNCIYCQVGSTPSKAPQRRQFYEPEAVVAAVREKAVQTQAIGGHIDYLTFVPDGEPTLDLNLGYMIDQLRELNLKIAVISNASLLWRDDVRKELAKADCVSLKVDAVSEKTWRRINRPATALSLQDILDGALTFAASFQGVLLTETMLIEGINDSGAELMDTAQFLGRLYPATAYLAIPTRPPAETRAKAPGEGKLVEAFQIFSEHLESVEVLTGYSPEPFTTAGDAVQNLLDITCVHPMRESEVQALFEKAGVDRSVLQELLVAEEIVRVVHGDEPFYIRKGPQ